ncbi:MAG: ParB/RepB/Spo0J family partition protein [Candidatus Electryoneaceae bacterium]|nr:ParB/RepB/Spo0J family partition protein [Candidatus Electryoneaceae bacterium]
MEEIRNIATAVIDPDSSVNVRRSQIADSVATVKRSIEKQGFWGSSPISVRLHPDRDSDFEYEVVAGQCRLRACLELGLEEIPAIVQDLNDDEALQQSWAENEFSSDIVISDKAYWIHEILLRYAKKGKSLSDAREVVADFFNISVATVIKYRPLAALPEEAKKLLDEGRLQVQDATVIAQHTFDGNPNDSEKRIMERTKWIMELNVDERKAARKAIGKSGPLTPLEQLETKKEGFLDMDREILIEKIEVPKDLHSRLLKWGEERGLSGVDASKIISYMIVDTLGKDQ